MGNAVHRAGSVTADLSVVVCSHNGERRLPSTLASLRRQTLRRPYEVIVVDDGSRDRTSEVARLYGARVVTLERDVGLGGARNAGVSVAEGSIVAFTDDDCEPAQDWLAAIQSAFSDRAVDGVGGRVLPACANAFLLRYLTARNPLTPLGEELLESAGLAYRLRLYLQNVMTGRPGLAEGVELYSVVGANMAFRRDVIMGLGGFDEAFTFGGEEEDLCRRAHARPQGARLRYEPSALVSHSFQPKLGDSLRRARAYGRGHARGSIKDRDLRLIPYPFPLLLLAAAFPWFVARRGPLGPLALAPLAGYARWPSLAWRSRSIEPLAYPYLQLAEELWTMIGELEGLVAGYTSIPSTHLSPERSAFSEAPS